MTEKHHLKRCKSFTVYKYYKLSTISVVESRNIVFFFKTMVVSETRSKLKLKILLTFSAIVIFVSSSN